MDDTRGDHSLALTAGHCVIDKGKFATMWTFIPEYDSNPVAYNNCNANRWGCWTAEALYVHENFAAQRQFNTTAVTHDFAFALLGLGGKSGESKSLETTVGGNFAISFTGPLTGTTLTALGYPAGAPYDGSQLTYCQGPIGQDSRVNNATWKMACDMTGGSSGGPWGDGYMDNYSDTLRSLNSYGYSGEAYMYGPKFNSKTEAVYNAADGGPITNTRVTGG